MDALLGCKLNGWKKKASRQLHKNAASNTEQVLEATPHKAPTIRPPTSYHENYQVRRTRYAGHCWRSRDELISDLLLWTPTYGRIKAGRPARTYIQQLCEDTWCTPEDLPKAMNDREKWWERVWDICAGGTIWCWWWWLILFNDGLGNKWSTKIDMALNKENKIKLVQNSIRNIPKYLLSVFFLI